MLVRAAGAGVLTPRRATKLAMAMVVAITPALANAGNTTRTLVGNQWHTVKSQIDSEIGFSGAIADIWDCSQSRCSRKIAEWYFPDQSLYVRLEGGAATQTLTVGDRCEALDCAAVARLSGGERPRLKR